VCKTRPEYIAGYEAANTTVHDRDVAVIRARVTASG